MQGRACKQYIFQSYNVYFQCCAFRWKSFHMPVRKRRQKSLRASNFTLLWVVFKWHHRSEGTKSTLFFTVLFCVACFELTLGIGSLQVTWCFMPSQPLRLYEAETGYKYSFSMYESIYGGVGGGWNESVCGTLQKCVWYLTKVCVVHYKLMPTSFCISSPSSWHVQHRSCCPWQPQYLLQSSHFPALCQVGWTVRLLRTDQAGWVWPATKVYKVYSK